MATYNIPSIDYYRVNATNTAIATSPRGDSGTPSEPILPPSAEGTFQSVSGFEITGSGGDFENWDPGMYLYYTEALTGQYVLMGQIATIDGPLQVTLEATPLATEANAVLSASFSLITINESIYIRIATSTSGAPNGSMNIPNFASPYWRTGAGVSSNNNASQASLTQFSATGTPISTLSPTVNIPFTFLTKNQFSTSDASSVLVTKYWNSAADFPNFIWIMITPRTSATSSSLNSQTLYRLSVEETSEALVISANFDQQLLSNAGYSLA